MKSWKTILFLSLLVAFILSPFASPHPDGLERVAENLSFAEKATSALAFSPMPDYTVPGISNEKISTATAGIIGTSVAFAAVFLAAKALKRGEARD
ncbi:MAG: PDGLE domain-containing protein [Tepidanaerobacteraceae bacterium]|jgi:cobalt/nickel transport protein|nr:PDGLE domain-containing protein [Tepidanaerobacteraceae bacterium]